MDQTQRSSSSSRPGAATASRWPQLGNSSALNSLGKSQLQRLTVPKIVNCAKDTKLMDTQLLCSSRTGSPSKNTEVAATSRHSASSLKTKCEAPLICRPASLLPTPFEDSRRLSLRPSIDVINVSANPLLE